MRRGRTGTYITTSTVGGEPVRAFVPDALPPNPPLNLTPALREELDQALLDLGRLDSVASLLPDTLFFLYTYVRKEAVLSSQIEGTQSSLSDLLLFELDEVPGVPLDDVVEVSSYVAALTHGLARLREGFPLSNRLLREIHAILLSKGRGADRAPGEFRRSQNWIGGTRPGDAKFVPPPPERVEECMSALERFLHDEPEPTSALVKAALSHVQFETIHPFLDGNGRVGRLLITLLFCTEGILKEPLLYLSLHFKRHRDEYYEFLDRVRTEGDWEAWIRFFSGAVASTAREAVEAAKSLVKLFEDDRARIQRLARSAGSALQVHHEFKSRPVNSIGGLAQATGLSAPTVSKALSGLESLGIVREMTGRRRRRLYCYSAYLDILGQE
jgi:Fic family protein